MIRQVVNKIHTSSVFCKTKLFGGRRVGCIPRSQHLFWQASSTINRNDVKPVNKTCLELRPQSTRVLLLYIFLTLDIMKSPKPNNLFSHPSVLVPLSPFFIKSIKTGSF